MLYISESPYYPYVSFTNAYLVSPDYRIKKGDILYIVFYGEFNQIYMQQVTSTGEIWILTSLTIIGGETEPGIRGPNLGFFKVEGKTLKEIENAINENLKKRYKGTKARVYLAEYGKIKVHIVGNVERPGEYYLTNSSTLIEALKKAECDIKNTFKIKIKRGTTELMVDIKKYLEKGDISNNPILLNNDIIIVPWNSEK
jgi:protein involved in polysaccharide export with SLBB domain